MATPYTTIRVYRKDKALLNKKFAGTDDKAFHELITKVCPHPEEKRQYVTAELPLQEDEAIMENRGGRIIGGFLCTDCKTYIFNRRGQIVIPNLPE